MSFKGKDCELYVKFGQNKMEGSPGPKIANPRVREGMEGITVSERKTPLT